MPLTSSPSSLLITCPYHLNLISLIFSAMSTTPHLLISSFHNVSDQFSFISSYYVSISSQPCFPHLLCNVYHLTSSDLFIPQSLSQALLLLLLDVSTFLQSFLLITRFLILSLLKRNGDHLLIHKYFFSVEIMVMRFQRQRQINTEGTE